MKNYIVLKRNDDFNSIINEGKKITNSHFIVYFLPSFFFKREKFSVGISVGKKLGNAPFRNYQKRKVRMAVQSNLGLFKDYQYVIIVRPVACKDNYANLEKKLISLLKGIS